MRLKRSLISIILIFFIVLYSFTQIKVACVGDSITFGFTIENRDQNSYPAQLGRLLGKNWEVKNFGVIGATLLKKGDMPYWKQKAWAYLPAGSTSICTSSTKRISASKS